ncbi:unnamed protein product [Mycena citricolor]|uniref:Exocyst complex component EXO84 n=2 Tax=Mycena citricolor TaxID=2018698 RepID=A0AAD2Q128_9AGAR|nr:unnamed protein product [Mycena citricolor]
MQSLRTRRDAPTGKSQRQPARTPRPNGGATPRRDARKSRVDDKIKKRMSMRYADISSPGDLGIPSMPPIPALPGRTAGSREQDEVVMDRGREREDRGADDKKLLDKDDFDPDIFLKLKLANSTEYELKSLQSSLRNTKDDTASELQRNVFKNYAEFVLISKEISTLENEVLELKESLSEYKSMPSLLNIPDPTATTSAGLSSYRRSSVADLRIMYFNQMQTLHSQIEGSAKFAPTTPGRHVVAEFENVIGLNAATYKATGKVKFVVLDDAVLVARRRRRGGDGGTLREGKLVAERCWPLNDMLVLDTKDSPSMTNVLKIRQGKETHVYRTETPGEKKALLTQFRLVAEELAAKKRKEREGEHERRKSMWNGGPTGDSDRPPLPDWMADLARRAGDTEQVSDAKEKAERDGRWATEWADNLTVSIALREWEKATELVESGKSQLATNTLLASKLPPLTAQLTSALLGSLASPTNRKSSVVSLISLLLRLNAGPAARTAFLKMRTAVMQSHVRRIRFEGHVGAYVGDLAVVYFTGIKHTADWFLASFKENEVASAFIDWAKTQIEDYGELFRTQVYSSDVDPKVVDEAMTITYAQSKKLLQEYGLDFRFLFNDVLSENPKGNILVPTNFTLQGHQVTKAPRHAPPALTLSASSSSSRDLKVNVTPPLPSAPPTASSPMFSPSPPLSSSGSREPLTATRSAFRIAPVPRASSPAFSEPPVASPAPRRTRSPLPTGGGPRSQTPSGTRERPMRSRASPAPSAGPPPRSSNRPGSGMTPPRVPSAAVPQREGMF